MSKEHGNSASQIGNKNASKGKENHTSNIHILLPSEQKGMIKKVIAGNKPLAPSCLDALMLMVEFNIHVDELREILEQHAKNS